MIRGSMSVKNENRQTITKIRILYENLAALIYESPRNACEELFKSVVANVTAVLAETVAIRGHWFSQKLESVTHERERFLISRYR